MLTDFVWDPHAQKRLQGTRLAACLDTLVAYLQQRGHAERTIGMYGRAAGHFASWLSLLDTPLSAIDAAMARRFLDRHLPRCSCPTPGSRTRFTVRAALHHFLMILRREELVPPAVSTEPPTISMAVASYDAFLCRTCGLAEATRIYRRRYVREFLEATFEGRPITIADLRPVDIENFVTARAQRYRPGSAQVLASSIRSWLRYQQLIGACEAHLIATVPRIPRRRLAGLPHTLSDDDVSRLLETFDRATPTGLRDHAMARCLVGLGLRASEVARLQLDDVDWHRGRLRISATKARRADWLPLSARVGQAIVAYPRRGRPKTTARALFVRHRPPVGVAIRPSMVGQALQRAANAAELDDRWRGPHMLRHTVATRLLRGGASLKEIADVLRHRSFDTTAIYTKVDREALTAVALRWPGALNE